MEKITIAGKTVELPSDDEMTIKDDAMYLAGQLSILYKLIDTGIMTYEQVSDAVGVKSAMVRHLRPVWDECGIMAQSEMMRAMMITTFELLAAEDIKKEQKS